MSEMKTKGMEEPIAAPKIRRDEYSLFKLFAGLFSGCTAAAWIQITGVVVRRTPCMAGPYALL